MLDGIEVGLNECWAVRANQHVSSCTRHYRKYQGHLNQAQPGGILSESNEATIQVNLPDALFSGVSTQSHHVTYNLILTARISFSNAPRRKKDISVETKINIQNKYLSEQDEVASLLKEKHCYVSQERPLTTGGVISFKPR